MLIIFRNRIMLRLIAISSSRLPRFSVTVLRSQACSPEGSSLETIYSD